MNNIGDSGAIKIGESLMKNTTLTELYLRRVIGKRELMQYNEETEGGIWNNDKNEQITKLGMQERLRWVNH